MVEPSDDELAERATAGDRDAFGELYRRHADRLYDFALRTVRNPDTAADVVQTVFLVALRSLQQKRGAFRPWLFGIAHHQAINELRRRRRVGPLPEAVTEEGETVALEVVDPDRLASPEEALLDQEASRLVWAAAAALRPREYALLDLHLRQGLSAEEIAGTLGLRTGNVYTMLSRLRRAMEEAVGTLLLVRRGRAECPALQDLLPAPVADLNQFRRRAVDRHTRVCSRCAEDRRRFAAPTAIFGGLAVVPMPAAAKAWTLDRLLPLLRPPTPGEDVPLEDLSRQLPPGRRPPAFVLTMAPGQALALWGGVGLVAKEASSSRPQVAAATIADDSVRVHALAPGRARLRVRFTPPGAP